MAGRYPNDNQVSKHPAFDEGSEKAAENIALHQERAAELRPATLNADEGVIWDRITPELSRSGRLKVLFVDFIEQYCVVKARMDGLRTELDDEQWVYMTQGRHGIQWKSRPEVAQFNDDWRKWNSLIAQLGLSPATELRFNDKQGSLFDDDEFGSI